MNFSERLKEISNRIDLKHKSKRPTGYKPQVQVKDKVLYDVHKRDLPPTGYNRPVAWNLHKEDAQRLVRKVLKTKEIPLTDDGIRRYYYYEIVGHDGLNKGIYDNPKNTTEKP